MANIKRTKGSIAILTGGGDVPGLNPAIRAITIRAIREGFRVIGIRRGWKGLISCVRDAKLHQEECFHALGIRICRAIITFDTGILLIFLIAMDNRTMYRNIRSLPVRSQSRRVTGRLWRTGSRMHRE